MIECYSTECINHICHFEPEEGPFCSLNYCSYYPIYTMDDDEENNNKPLNNRDEEDDRMLR